MKKIIYTLFFGLTIFSLSVQENAAQEAAIQDALAEIKQREAQTEFSDHIQADLNTLENDMAYAQEYHLQEKAYQAKEEEKTEEAAALLDLIRQEALAEEKLEKTETQIAEDILQNLTTQESQTLNAIEQEILQEPELRDDIQEAAEKIETIEIG